DFTDPSVGSKLPWWPRKLGEGFKGCRVMTKGGYKGASCTQRKVSMVPFVFSIPFVLSWGGSISSDSFLPSILLLVDKASSVRLPVANVTLSSSTHLLRENTDSQLVLPELQQYHQQSVTGWQPEKILEFKTSRDRYRDNGVSDPIKGLVFLVSVSSSYSGTGSLSSWSRCVVYLLLSTDEDGDTRMGDSTGVSVSLGGEISSGGKKSQEYSCISYGNKPGASIEDILGATTQELLGARPKRDTWEYYQRGYGSTTQEILWSVFQSDYIGALPKRDWDGLVGKNWRVIWL
ncbi:hypothetical protein Tco_0847400, partial [Tanacetum coccineum]